MNANRILITAILVALSVACAWAGGPEPQVTSSSDFNTAVASLTSTLSGKPSSPVSIANGGTGATTGDAALSALGISNHNQITVYSSGAASFAKDISQNYVGTHGNVGHRDIAFGRSSTAVPCFIATGTITGNGDVVYIVCDIYAVREADVASGAAVFRVSAKAGKTGGTATFETPVVDTVKATEAGLSAPSAAWTTSGNSGSLWITPGDTYVAYYVQTSIVTRGGGAFTW